jgi:hypothetical protein
MAYRGPVTVAPADAQQILPPDFLKSVPKELPKVVTNARTGFKEVDPSLDPRIRAIAPPAPTGTGRQAFRPPGLDGWEIPLDIPGQPATDARGNPFPKYVAKYDPQGNFQEITTADKYFVTAGQGDKDKYVIPKIDLNGRLISMGSGTPEQQKKSIFRVLADTALEAAPLYLAALGGASLLGGSSIFGGAAGAGGAGAGAAGAGAAGAAGAGVPGGLLGSTLPAGAGAGGFFAPGVTAGAATLGIPTMTGAPAGVTPSVAGGLPGASSSIPTTSAVTTSTVAGAPAAAAPAVGAGADIPASTPSGYGYTTPPGEFMGPIAPTSTGLISDVLGFAKENPQLTGAAIGAITGAIDAANAPKEQTTTTSIDPEIKAKYMENLARAETAAANLGVRQFAQPGQMYTDAEKQLYNLGMTPFGAADIQQFFNPYEEQVVQGALGDIERSRLMQDIADRERASRAGAFGGSRQAVQSALTNEAALRQAATTASGLRQTGFNTAANLGLSARPLNMAGLTTSMGLGAQRDALRQAELDAARNIELERLGITSGALGLQPARTGETSSQPLYTSGVGSALSGGLTGAYIGSLLKPT